MVVAVAKPIYFFNSLYKHVAIPSFLMSLFGTIHINYSIGSITICNINFMLLHTFFPGSFKMYEECFSVRSTLRINYGELPINFAGNFS